jgi:hypothetical protein
VRCLCFRQRVPMCCFLTITSTSGRALIQNNCMCWTAAQCAERAERMTSPGVGSTYAMRSETASPCGEDGWTGLSPGEIDGHGALEGGRVHEPAAIK